MKITRRQLKQFIKESILVEGNHAVEYAVGYEDARDGLPQNSDDPWYAAGFADYLEGIHDQYEALHQDGITTPPPQAGQMEGRKLRKKRLRRIIKEYGYGGNLTLDHVRKVFPRKSRGEQIDIHEEFGESTNNAQELIQAYTEKYGSLD